MKIVRMGFVRLGICSTNSSYEYSDLSAGGSSHMDCIDLPFLRAYHRFGICCGSTPVAWEGEARCICSAKVAYFSLHHRRHGRDGFIPRQRTCPYQIGLSSADIMTIFQWLALPMLLVMPVIQHNHRTVIRRGRV